MKRIIIFRFHKSPRICKNRIDFIKKFNPTTPIYGIYGGTDADLPLFKKTLGDSLVHIFNIKGKTKSWKWRHFDLALREWYQAVGSSLDFDMAHIIEWDLLLFDSVENLYKNIRKNEIGITGLVPLSTIESKWSWTSKEPERSEWLQLLKLVTEKYHYKQKPWGSLGPGLCVPKSFLEQYTKADVPTLGHDELRVPLYAQIFKIRLQDTGFYHGWFSEKNDKDYFNCNGDPILASTIQKQLSSGTRKAFHPFRKIWKF